MKNIFMNKNEYIYLNFQKLWSGFTPFSEHLVVIKCLSKFELAKNLVNKQRFKL